MARIRLTSKRVSSRTHKTSGRSASKRTSTRRVARRKRK